MNIGEMVTVKVRNTLYKKRNLYSSGTVIPEYNTYTGQVITNPPWVALDSICLTTGIVEYPFRVISKSDIITGENQVVQSNTRTAWEIAGSNGKKYLVTRNGGQWSCNCVGYGYRRHCSHVVSAKSLEYQGNPKSLETQEISEKPAKSLKTKAKKNSKKSKKSALLSKRNVVEYMGKLEMRAKPCSYKMKGSKMPKVDEKFGYGGKQKIAIDIMEANLGKSYDEVCELIAKAIDVTPARAGVYFRDKTLKGLVKGYENMSRPYPWEKARATKEVPAKKLLKEVGLSDKLQKSVDELAKIKAKNLETMKVVHRKYNQVARPESSEKVSKAEMAKRKAAIQAFTNYETDELPSFASPESLTRDQVKALV